jgi:hypothetical protein
MRKLARRPRQSPEKVRVFLDREPIVLEIAAWRRANSTIALSRLARVPDRTIRWIVSGESAHVRLDMADKLACAIDLPLSYLYRDQRVSGAEEHSVTPLTLRAAPALNYTCGRTRKIRY